MTYENIKVGISDPFTLCVSLFSVSCSFPSKNITIKIDENSNYPHYLAFVIRYQQGKKDITAVQLCEVLLFPVHCNCAADLFFFMYIEPRQNFLTHLHKEASADIRQEFILSSYNNVAIGRLVQFVGVLPFWFAYESCIYA